jgi:hypothetical protein
LLPLLETRWQILAIRRIKLLRMTMRDSMRAQFFFSHDWRAEAITVIGECRASFRD